MAEQVKIKETFPQRAFVIPGESQFEFEGEFLIAQELKAVGKKLISDFAGEFAYLDAANITYLWKRKGGKTKGKDTLGKCELPKGLLRHFAGCDFIVWLAADNCIGFSHYQIAALLFHELKHATWDSETGEYKVVGHDFEGFFREVELFGDWLPDIEHLRRAFDRHQPDLFADAEAAATM